MKSVFAFSLLLILASCDLSPVQDDQNFMVCGISNPIKKISWVNNFYEEIKDQPEINGIVVFRYNGEEIIELQKALYSSTNLHQFKCDGNRLVFDENNTYENYLSSRTKVGVLYGTNLWFD